MRSSRLAADRGATGRSHDPGVVRPRAKDPLVEAGEQPQRLGRFRGRKFVKVLGSHEAPLSVHLDLGHALPRPANQAFSERFETRPREMKALKPSTVAGP